MPPVASHKCRDTPCQFGEGLPDNCNLFPGKRVLWTVTRLVVCDSVAALLGASCSIVVPLQQGWRGCRCRWGEGGKRQMVTHKMECAASSEEGDGGG